MLHTMLHHRVTGAHGDGAEQLVGPAGHSAAGAGGAVVEVGGRGAVTLCYTMLQVHMAMEYKMY